jgi:glycosyltransferase involved in cell wall biosynthesis
VLGVLVPCRDEAAVIARKLLNLAALEWPPARGPHRIVVVDDGSTDGTAERALALSPRLERAGLGLEVVPNTRAPGKAGALRTGLRTLDGAVDLVVVTDADVVCEQGALAALARAFAADPALGMACGAQRFVRDLAHDGSPRGADGGPPRPAAGLYDRVTALMRRLESRAGRLFSVHGQLLAWREDLELWPTPGYAADDLVLRLHARLRGVAVRQIAGACFLEVKTPAGPAREAQALRRARAYVQLLRHPRLARLAGRAGALERLQLWAYRRLPTAAPWLVPSAGAALLAGCALLLPSPWAAVVVLAGVGLALSPVGRRLWALLAVIRAATRSERAGPLSDRWETPRA